MTTEEDDGLTSTKLSPGKDTNTATAGSVDLEVSSAPTTPTKKQKKPIGLGDRSISPPLLPKEGAAKEKRSSPTPPKSPRRLSPKSTKTRSISPSTDRSQWSTDGSSFSFTWDDSDDEEQAHPPRNKYAEEIKSTVKAGTVTKLLEQAKQKERATKPMTWKSVRAQALKLDLPEYEPTVYKKDQEQEELLNKATRKSTVLKHFVTKGAQNDIRTLVGAFENITVEGGATIVAEGDQDDDYYYIVESGTIEITGGDGTVQRSGRGSTFGERNLLFPGPWNQTIRAVGDDPIKLLRLRHKSFRGIIHTSEEAKKPPPEPTAPPTPKEMQREVEVKKWFKKWFDRSKVLTEADLIRQAIQQHAPSTQDLEKIRILGDGQYGEVWLVETKLSGVDLPPGKTRHEFALKTQSIVEDPTVLTDTIKTEISVMKALSHPFTSIFYYSYESDVSIDILMGVIPGGDLWALVHKENPETGEWLSGIPETHAQFYSMVVADTLSFIHNKGYIYRDLKFENIMIDAKGYPIIVDFGFAQECPNKRYTFCGTPNYLSPEIIYNAGYNATADWWALGIIIYEMVTGENPFYFDGLDQMEVFRSICEDPPAPLKGGFSSSVVDIVDKLLIKDPEQRLGSGNKKGADILSHAFYKGVNLRRLRLRKVRAPWIPGDDNTTNNKDFEADLHNESNADEAERNRPEELDEAILGKEEEERVVPEEIACVNIPEQAKQEGDERETTEKETIEDDRRLKDTKAASEAEKLRPEAETVEAEPLQQEAMREAEKTEERMKSVEVLYDVEDVKVRPTSVAHEEALSRQDISRSESSPVRREASWGVDIPEPVRRFGVNPVEKGLVQKLVVGHGMGVQSPKGIYSPKLQDEMTRTIGKGLVAQRLAQAREHEAKLKGTSLFSDSGL